MTVSISGSNQWVESYNYPEQGEFNWDVELTEQTNALADRTRYNYENKVDRTGDTISGGLVLDGDVSATDGSIDFSSSLVPTVSGGYDLGAPDRPWRELYLTGNTMYLDGQPIAIDGNRLTFQNTKIIAYTDEITDATNNLTTEINSAKNSTTIDVTQSSHGFSVGDIACLKDPVNYWGLYHIGNPTQTGDYTKALYNNSGTNYVTLINNFTGYQNSSSHWCEWSDGSFDGTPATSNALPEQLHGSIVTYEMPIAGSTSNNVYSGLTTEATGLFVLSDPNGLGFDPDRNIGFLILQIKSYPNQEIRVFQRTVENGSWEFLGSHSTYIASGYSPGVWCTPSFTGTSMEVSDRFDNWRYDLAIPETDKVIYGFYNGKDGTTSISTATPGSYGSAGFLEDENTTFWTKATTSDPTKSRFGGVVSSVEDSNNFTVTTGGYISGLSGLIPGKMYYLAGSDGDYTQYKPNVGKSIALFQAISSSEATVGVTSENDIYEETISELSDMSDVDITTIPISAGQYLAYDGSNVVNQFDEYSRSEVATNKTWVDGKRIYRKVLDFGALPNNTSKDVAHGITGLDQFTSISAISTDGTNTLVLPYIGDGTDSINAFRSGSNIRITTNDNRSSHQCDVILEYTKT